MRFLLFILFVSFSCIGLSQKWETGILPNTVKLNYDKIFPVSTIKRWKKTNEGVYVVKLEDKDQKIVIARFEENGLWIETISYISKKEVPLKIVEETERTYPHAISIDYKLRTKADGVGSYLIDVITDEEYHEIVYSLSGEFVNITTSEN